MNRQRVGPQPRKAGCRLAVPRLLFASASGPQHRNPVVFQSGASDPPFGGSGAGVRPSGEHTDVPKTVNVPAIDRRHCPLRQPLARHGDDLCGGPPPDGAPTSPRRPAGAGRRCAFAAWSVTPRSLLDGEHAQLQPSFRSYLNRPTGNPLGEERPGKHVGCQWTPLRPDDFGCEEQRTGC